MRLTLISVYHWIHIDSSIGNVRFWAIVWYHHIIRIPLSMWAGLVSYSRAVEWTDALSLKKIDLIEVRMVVCA